MRSVMRIGFSLATALALSACATPPPVTPEPAKSVDTAKFYTGRWYEIGRTPMYITNGCVAGSTDYSYDANGQLHQFDACHSNTPEGAQKSIQGPVTILDPGENNKILVHYHVFYGLIPINHTYWIEDHDAAYSWFIFSDPAFKNINIYTRVPRPDPALVQDLTARVKAMGYDTSKLEFPTEFPPGMQ